jgi:hypothetical protein
VWSRLLTLLLVVALLPAIEFEKPVKKVTSKATFTQEDNKVTVETNFSEIFGTEDFLKTIIKTK